MKKLVLLIFISIAVYGADSESGKQSIDTHIWCSGMLQVTATPIHTAITLIEKVGNNLFMIIPPNNPNYPKPYCTTLGLQPESIFDLIIKKAKK